MATLRLCKFENGELVLQGDGDPSQNADFSLYDLDGEGGDPFAFGNREWEIVEGVPGVEYDPQDSDTFWAAVEQIEQAIAAK